MTMDFVSRLPTTSGGNNGIWVILDGLIKSAHFLAIMKTNIADQLAHTYISKIVRLHGVLLGIVSDRDAKVTSGFWRAFQSVFWIKVYMSTAYPPQTYGHQLSFEH